MLLIVIMNPCVRGICVRLRVGYERSSNAQFRNDFRLLASLVPSRVFPPQTGGAPSRRGPRAEGPFACAPSLWGAPVRAHGAFAS